MPQGYLFLSLLAVAVTGCAVGVDGSTPPKATEVQQVDAVAVEHDYSDEGSFTLSTARLAPKVQAKTMGAYTYEYVGPHRYYDDDVYEEMVADAQASMLEDEDSVDVDAAGDTGGGSALGSREVADEIVGSIYVDGDGHEWQVVGVDRSEVARLAALYQAAHPAVDGTEGTYEEDGGVGISDIEGTRNSNWYRSVDPPWECGDSWEYRSGDTIVLHTRWDQEAAPVLDRYPGSTQTAVLIAPNLALTAGHVANNVLRNREFCQESNASGQDCQLVDSVFVYNPPSPASTPKKDWGLIKFQGDFAQPMVMVLASGSDSYISGYTPRHSGYKDLYRTNGYWCTTAGLLDGDRSLGTIDSLTLKSARLNVTTGGGASGGPYYFWNSYHGDYRVFGVHSGRDWNLGINPYAIGPKVPYYYSDIVSEASAMGVTL